MVRQLQGCEGVGKKQRVLPARNDMQPWIIEELWRREEEEQRRRDELERRREIHIDAPMEPAREEPTGDEAPRRGVLIIEL